MAQVTITINSREYAVACEDGQEVRIMQLSRLLDEKARMITGGSLQVNENMLLAMVGLLLADELTELKKGHIPAAAPAPTVDNSRLLDMDASLAEKLQNLAQEINSVAKKIESFKAIGIGGELSGAYSRRSSEPTFCYRELSLN